MIERITEYLMDWCQRRGRVLKITGTQGPDDIYLIRYYLFRNRFFNVFIHQFLRSDLDDLHDHPWNFATYLVRGAYTEYKWDGDGEVITRRRGPGTEEELCGRFHPKYENRLVFRKSTDQHKVVVDYDVKEDRKDLAPLTICVTGPIKRVWGFWKDEVRQVPCPDNQRPPGARIYPTCGVYHTKKFRVWVDWRE